MITKATLKKVEQISNNEEAAVALFNDNFAIIEDVFKDYVSRTGRIPTEMKHSLDMGSQRIINLGKPTGDNDAVRYKDVRQALEETKKIADYAESAHAYSKEAASHVDTAKGFAMQAKSSEEAAEDSSERAQKTADEIAANLDSSQQAATAAANSAAVAKGHADTASASAREAKDSSTLATQAASAATAAATTAEEAASNAEADAQNALESMEHAMASEEQARQFALFSSEKADEALASAEEAQRIKDSLGSVYVFKGSVPTFSQLPSNAEVGDVYDVTDSGVNYAWNGSEWDSLGASVDMSLYATKEEVSNKLPLSGGTLTGSLLMGNSSVYLTDISDSVGASKSKLVLGSPENEYVYLTGNTGGAFGIYSDKSGTRKGITCYPGTSFFPVGTTKTMDFGRSANVWKTGFIQQLNDGTNAVKIADIATKEYVDTTEQDIITNFMDADTDLQTQINGQATAIAGKQDKLTAGENISINGNVISATGGSSVSSLSDIAIAGNNIVFAEGGNSYSVVGTPTIVDNVASFTRGNYISTPNYFAKSGVTFIEFVVAFEMPSVASTMIMATESPSTAPLIRLQVSASGAVGLNYTDTAGASKTATISQNVEANKKTYFKFVFNGSNVIISYSYDGTTWLGETSRQDFRLPKTNDGSNLVWGQAGTTGAAFTGKLYLEESYIKTSLETFKFVETKTTISTKENYTNCITEVPQDIKLELNNGTLTLKAGSKVYVPNGSGKFDELIISSDLGKNDWAADTGYVLIFINTSGSYIYASKISECSSGTSSSSIGGLYYRTGENYIYPQNNSANGSYSFPIAIAHLTNGVPDDIFQVFNGFGYIGSTVFVLPGVKGLIPNGKNEDGSLNNIECVYTSPQTLTLTSGWGTGNETFFINGANLDIHRGSQACYVSDSKPSVRYTNSFWFNPKENQHYYTTDVGVSWAPFYSAKAFEISFTAGVVDALKSKTTFQAVDYSDKETVVGWGMPKYKAIVNIGNKYTAPSNGFLRVRAYNNGGTAYGYIDGMEVYNWIDDGNSRGTSFIQISKGSEWTINGNFEVQQFIPCLGG